MEFGMPIKRNRLPFFHILMFGIILSTCWGIGIVPAWAVTTYVSDVQKILKDHCTDCHNPNGSKNDVPLDDYSSAQIKGDRIIARAVEEGNMPPGGTLSSALQDLLKFWEDDGYLRFAFIFGVNSPGTDSVSCTTLEGGTESECQPSVKFSKSTISATLRAKENDLKTKFASWSNCPNSSGTQCTVTTEDGPIVSTKTITANFTEVGLHSLVVQTTGNGSVTSDPPGIDCGEDCDEQYKDAEPYQIVKLIPKAGAGLGSFGPIFDRWSGDPDCQDGMVTMNQSKICTANFISFHQGTYSRLRITTTGKGNVTTAPEGTPCKLPGDTGFCALYTKDALVILAPHSDSMYKFDGWSGDEACLSGTVTMNSSWTCTADFSDVAPPSPIFWSLGVNKTGTGSGTVTSAPSGINCGSDCTESYVSGTSVTLTAAASNDSTFGGWNGSGCSGSGTCVVNMTAERAVTATFNPILRTLTVTKAGTGSGTVISSPTGINCGSDCTETYNTGQSVTLTATANGGSNFAGWSGSGCSGSGTCVVNMTAERAVTSTFSPPSQFTLQLTLAGMGSGTLTSSPAGINCGSDCKEAYADGTKVTLTAKPGTDSTFGGWSGACSGTTNSCTVLMTQSRVVGATFTPKNEKAPVITYDQDAQAVFAAKCSGSCHMPAGFHTWHLAYANAFAKGPTIIDRVNRMDALTMPPSSALPLTTSERAILNKWATDGFLKSAAAAPLQHTLTVTKAGEGSGTVTSSPAGISCGNDCSESYAIGTVVTLTATAGTGSTFAGWGGGAGTCSGTTNPCSGTMTAARTVTATFTGPLGGGTDLADLNGDGKADLVWRNTSDGSTAIWLMNGTTLATSGFPGGVPLVWQIIGIGDVDADGKADVIWRNPTSGAVAVWLMNGTTVLSTGFAGSAPVAWEIAGVGDVDGNGTADLVWRNTSDGSTAIWLMNGTTRAATGFLGGVPAVWHIAGVGDVNGDGKADVLWRNSANGTVAVWVMNGLTRTSVRFPGNAPLHFAIKGMGDVDGNGTADVIWRNTTSGGVVVWLMNGTTVPMAGFLSGQALAWNIGQVGDVTGDGKADIIWRDSSTGAVEVWVMNGTTVTTTGFPGTVSTVWEIQ